MLSLINLHGGPYASNCFLVFDSATGEAAVFDPAASLGSFKAEETARGLKLKYLVLTHGHYDHMITLNEFREAYPSAQVAISKADADCLCDPYRSCAVFFSHPEFRSGEPDILLSGGDVLTLGDEKIDITATPGHTPGSMCFTFGDTMITGDTLFRDSIGRSDLPGGNTSVLFNTLSGLIELETDYKIYAGHGESTTLSREKKYNPYLREIK